MLAQLTVSLTPKDVGIGIVRVKLYSLVVVLDGPLVLAQKSVGITTEVVGIMILRV